jgi:hypothetical protein
VWPRVTDRIVDINVGIAALRLRGARCGEATWGTQERGAEAYCSTTATG